MKIELIAFPWHITLVLRTYYALFMLLPRCGYSDYLSSLVATDSTVVNIPVQSILHTFAKISGWSLGSQDIWILNINWASQEVLVVKNLASNAGDTRDAGSTSGLGRSPGEGSGNPSTPVFLPGEFHGQRSLRGYSPWGCKESDTTERQSNMINCTRVQNPMEGGSWWAAVQGVAGSQTRLRDFLLSRIGEGNGNPLQCSCLENPGDRGALWAAVYGVTQSRAQLKWLSSSSSRVLHQGVRAPISLGLCQHLVFSKCLILTAGQIHRGILLG